MIEKIERIEANVKLCPQDSEDEILIFSFGGSLDIFLSDGTKILGVAIFWDEEGSYIEDMRISEAECIIISKRICPRLKSLSKKFSENAIKICESIQFEKGFWDQFWVDNAMRK